MEDLKALIRDIPDFPKPGILFKDITTLLKDPRAFARVIDSFSQRYVGQSIEAVVSIEARGFVLGGAVAYRLGAGAIIVRKRGKLPWKTHKVTYELEYGTDELHIHQDAISPGQRVLILDDVLATGGTVSGVINLVEQLGGRVVECAFLAELLFLQGRDRLKPHEAFSLIQFS
ncbi:MAG: adenine phosphoribosyltransferase [Deltaproteobacteria bacterium]|nr:adenine phosphoribosyltransferase [Deltaproteobacteria bacterium]